MNHDSTVADAADANCCDTNRAAGRLRRLAVFQPRLVALARRRGAGWHDAQDVASDCILRVATAHGFDDDVDDPWPYLARTAANLVVERFRRSTHTDHQAGTSSARTEDFEDRLINQLLAAQLLRQLAQAEPWPTAQLLVGHLLEGRTWAELGAHWGTSADAARVRVTRALRRLRYRLDPS